MYEIDNQLLEQLHSLRDYIRWGASRFNSAGLHYGHGTDNAWDEAVQLVLHAVNLDDEFANPHVLDARLTKDERRRVAAVLSTRINERLPAPYLTHRAWFAGLRFYVDERVLIPRSPIAELIEQQFQPWLTQPPARVLDLCTGSGCIGIACAYAFPDAAVVLSDIDADALAVAERNIADHRLADRVRAVQSDGLAAVGDAPFDLIVSNPPYVDAEDMANLPREFQHEPQLALASGEDGLDFTRRLLAEAAAHLSEHGLLVVEVGNSAPALEAAFPELPFTWVNVERGGDGVFVLTREQLLAHSPA